MRLVSNDVLEWDGGAGCDAFGEFGETLFLVIGDVELVCFEVSDEADPGFVVADVDLVVCDG